MNNDRISGSTYSNIKRKDNWIDATGSVSTNDCSLQNPTTMSSGTPLVQINEYKNRESFLRIGFGDNTDVSASGYPFPTVMDVSSSSDQTMIDPEAAERAWAKELYEMNSDVRESINYELHGVKSRAFLEDPASIKEALRLFQIEIDTQIPPIHKQSYTRAVMGLKSNYVQTPDFRLRFLRAERFDVKKAAIRFCRGLDYLVDQFGEQALMRQLYLSDLSRVEERFLRSGNKQVLPNRDRFGRRLMAHFGCYSNEYSFYTRAKVMTYLAFGVLAEDLMTQRNGVVSLGFFSAEDNDLLMLDRKGFLRFFAAVPLRWSAFHLCIPPTPAFTIFKGLILSVIPKEVRRVTRIHSGTNLECEYSLRCFGIPTEGIPRTFTGKMKTKYLAKWMKIRTAMDDYRRMMSQNDHNTYYAKPPSMRAFPGIECPEVNCVLFRLAGLASTHPMNVEFRLYLEEKDGEREQLKTLRQKDDHLHQIIEETARRGLRFLVFDEERYWYTEITDYKTLRKHIFQAQRDIVKRAKARAQVQLSKSNTVAFTDLDGSTGREQNCLNACSKEDKSKADERKNRAR